MMIDNYSVSELELWWWWCLETAIELTWLRKRNTETAKFLIAQDLGISNAEANKVWIQSKEYGNAFYSATDNGRIDDITNTNIQVLVRQIILQINLSFETSYCSILIHRVGNFHLVWKGKEQSFLLCWRYTTCFSNVENTLTHPNHGQNYNSQLCIQRIRWKYASRHEDQNPFCG